MEASLARPFNETQVCKLRSVSRKPHCEICQSNSQGFQGRLYRQGEGNSSGRQHDKARKRKGLSLAEKAVSSKAR